MNSFKHLGKLKKTIDSYKDRLKKNEGEPPMGNTQKVVDWFKEKRIWWSLWILILITLLASVFFLKIDIDVDAEVKIKYEQPWDKIKNLGNKL